MFVASKQRHHRQDLKLDLRLGDVPVLRSDSESLLGVKIDNSLSWGDNVSHMVSKIKQRLGLLRRICPYLPREGRLRFFNSCVLPHFMYCCTVWSGCTANLINKLLKVQKQAARIILEVPFDTPSRQMFAELRWMPIDICYQYRRLCMVYKCYRGDAPEYLTRCVVPVRSTHTANTRFASHENLQVPRHRTAFYSRHFFVLGVTEWNALPNHIKEITSYELFRKRLHSHLMSALL